MTDKTSDIVERLRAYAEDGYIVPDQHLAVEAADEIERLQTLLDQAHVWMRGHKAEAERLRTSLLHRVMDEHGCGCLTSEDCTGWDAIRCGCAVEARDFLSKSALRETRE